MTIGERIKERRIELGLSQEELASRVNYKSRSSINKIELSRNLPIDKVETMAKALNCEPSYLMGWADLDGRPINQLSITSKIAPIIADKTRYFYFDKWASIFNEIPTEKLEAFTSYLENTAELINK